MFRGFWQDIRHTARTLRASPGFTLATIVTLGLAMALNTCLFSVINGLLLRPLAVPHPEQIVALFMNQDGVEDVQAFSYPDYQDIGAELNGVADIFAYTNTLARITAGGKMERGLVAMGDWNRCEGQTDREPGRSLSDASRCREAWALRRTRMAAVDV